MRANTTALLADSRFSLIDTPKGKWAIFRTQSPREMLDAAKAYSRTPNEQAWRGGGADWQGLGPEQDQDSLDSSGIPMRARNAMQSATAALVRKPSRPGQIRPSIVGGTWSVPAVLANLPLAARTRIRSKLPPLSIRIVCTWSASVRDSDLAPMFAKLARAIWDYTLAGGAVDLRAYGLGFARASSTGAKGIILETRVPCSDVSQIALALSNVYFRAITGPLCTAFSESTQDSIRVPQSTDNPIPGSIYIGGRTSTGNIGPTLEKALEALAVR